MRSRFLFCCLLHSTRLSSQVVSIPTNTVSNPASTIDFIKSSSSARFIDASVRNPNGYFLSFCHLIMAGRISSFNFLLLPMKLSSTRQPGSRQPRLYRASSSAISCSLVLVRGLLPFNTIISQNSQSKGQPREYWMFMVVYFLMFNSDHWGEVVLVVSVPPSEGW